MTTTTMGTQTSKPKANWIELSVVCAVFVALALIGIIWDFTSGLLTSGIDGIMMLFICLMMGGIFSLMILMMVHQAGLLPFFRAKPKATAETASKAPAPAAAAATKAATPVPATSPAAAPPLQASHPPAVLQPAPPVPPPAPKPAAKPAPVPAAKPQDS
jgi:outer membrane biosynthesis protein TonB